MNDTKKTYLLGTLCYAFVALCFFYITSVAGAMPQSYTPQQDALLDALIQVESSGRDDAVGDGGKAIGCLQIWQPYWYDATERSGIGGTYKDCYNRAYAKRIVDAYMTRYAKEAWTDPKLFNAEKCARMHNGGPKGHTKQATKKYWNKVDKLLK